jgi:divalent metal cation (Fe/Co/Zn/Cd) transporter
MTKWVIPMTVVIVIAGFAVMILWTSVNQLLSGHAAQVEWLNTAIAAVVVVVSTGIIVTFVNRFALATEESPR